MSTILLKEDLKTTLLNKAQKILMEVSDYYFSLTGKRIKEPPQLHISPLGPKYMYRSNEIWLKKDSVDEVTVAHEFAHAVQAELYLDEMKIKRELYPLNKFSAEGNVEQGSALFFESAFLNRKRRGNGTVYNIIYDMNALARASSQSVTMQSFFEGVKNTYKFAMSLELNPKYLHAWPDPEGTEFGCGIVTLLYMHQGFKIDRAVRRIVQPSFRIFRQAENTVRNPYNRSIFEKRFEELKSKLGLDTAILTDYT